VVVRDDTFTVFSNPWWSVRKSPTHLVHSSFAEAI
jgi:hypothetical protein